MDKYPEVNKKKNKQDTKRPQSTAATVTAADFPLQSEQGPSSTDQTKFISELLQLLPAKQ